MAKTQPSNWDNLRVLLAVARAGTFAGAARRLGVDETTVARRLAALSADMGTPVIEGPAGERRPTGAGTELVAIAEDMERRLATAVETVSDGRELVAGVVRITAVPLLVNHLLLPGLGELRATHPGVTPHLIASAETMSLLAYETDIALRFGAPGREANAVARRIATLSYGLYGVDADQPWLAYGGRVAEYAHGAATVALLGDETPIATVDDGDSMATAVSKGIGKGLLPVCIGDRIDGVSRLPLSGPRVTRSLWMVLHPDGRHLARVRAVADWTAALFSSVDDEANQWDP